MNNIIQDISILTTIPESNLKKLSKTVSDCISHYITESVLDKQDTCLIDLDIGTLVIGFENEELQFKFIPSKTLQKTIVDSVQNKESTLVQTIEDNLKDKIIFAYKNLI